MLETNGNGDPSWFVELMRRLIDGSISYLAAQVEAGAEALQIFDSWAGDLPESLHEDLVFAPIQAIIAGLQRRVGSVPVIVFARGLGAAHAALALACRPNAISVEPSVPLEWLRAEVFPNRCRARAISIRSLCHRRGGAGKCCSSASLQVAHAQSCFQPWPWRASGDAARTCERAHIDRSYGRWRAAWLTSIFG